MIKGTAPRVSSDGRAGAKRTMSGKSVRGKGMQSEIPVVPSEAALTFRSLVETYRFPMGSTRRTALTKFTFFAGAGMSKSWHAEAPVGQQLFSLGDLLDDTVGTEMMMRVFGVEPGEVGPEQVRQIVYQLDLYERYPDIRPRYVDDHNTFMMRAALRAAGPP